MKRRLISLMLAGAVLTSVGLITAGCGGNGKPEVEEGVTSGNVNEELYGKNLIVAVYEKQVVLHRADIYNRYIEYDGYSNWATSYWIGDRLDFKCGRPDDRTTMFHEYGTQMPDESSYDVLCEECFKTAE